MKKILLGFFFTLVSFNFVNAIYSTNIYVERKDQLDMVCEEYFIFDSIQGLNKKYYLFNEGFFELSEHSRYESGLEIIDYRIGKINTKKGTYKEYFIDGSEIIKSNQNEKFYFLQNGKVLYIENNNIIVLSDGFYSNNFKLYKSILLNNITSDISEIYNYNKSSVIEFNNGTYLLYDDLTKTIFKNKEELIQKLNDFDNVRVLLNNITSDNINIDGNKYYTKGEKIEGTSVYKFYIYKNNIKGEHSYRYKTSSGKGITFFNNYQVFGIHSRLDSTYTICTNKIYNSLIPNDEKTYLFHRHYHYEIKGEYLKKYLHIGEDKYGPYYDISNVVFGENGKSISYITYEGTGKDIIYKDFKKLNETKISLLYSPIIYKENSTDLYYPIYDDGNIHFYKNSSIVETIDNNPITVDGIKYEYNILWSYSVGNNGLTYRVSKSSLIESEKCFGPDNKTDCKIEKSIIGGKRIEKIVENGKVVKDFPKGDDVVKNEEKEKVAKSKDNQKSKDDYWKYVINDLSKGKLYKQLILSKKNLSKKKQKSIDKLVDGSLEFNKLQTISYKLSKLSLKIRNNKKYKPLLDYLEAKVNLRLKEFDYQVKTGTL